MTAASVELRRLLLVSLILSADIGRICGDGAALDRVSKHVRSKTHFFEGRHIVQKKTKLSEGSEEKIWQQFRVYSGMIE